jgi:hypothetical protein
MTGTRSPTGDYDGAGEYEIRLDGLLDARWAAWFDGLLLTTEQDETTTISGPVADQAALHGLLQRVRDVGLPLVSVSRLAPDRPDVTADPMPDNSPRRSS